MTVPLKNMGVTDFNVSMLFDLNDSKSNDISILKLC